MFRAMGLKKGDFVMTMLNRRYEYYIVNVACCKLGLVLVPATYLLTVKDIAYRVNAADVKAVICINEDEVIEYVEEHKRGRSYRIRRRSCRKVPGTEI